MARSLVKLCYSYETLTDVGWLHPLLAFGRLTTTRGRTVPTFATEGATTRRYRQQKTWSGIPKNLAFICFSDFICFLRILQPVILKELKQMDGDFNENQKIELNTVRLKTVGIVVSIQTETRLFLDFAPAALAYKTSLLSNTYQNCSFSFFWPSNSKLIPSSIFIR